ncbi:hypothetical protein Mgra_00006724, partial [Meloidogyne graminicola]
MFDYSDSDQSRDEEISLAEARRPYQINLNTDNNEFFKINNANKCIIKKKKRKNIFFELLIPRIFILIITIIYIFIIAITFYSVENENEIKEDKYLKELIEITKRNLMAQLHNISPQISIDKLYEETNKFSNKLLEIGWKRGIKRMSINSTKQLNNNNNNWSFINSFLFSISLISRIGYGHLVPMTLIGKQLVFPFAIFGIPLFILIINDLTKIFSIFFHWIYKILIKYLKGIKQQIIKLFQTNKNKENEKKLERLNNKKYQNNYYCSELKSTTPSLINKTIQKELLLNKKEELIIN